MEQTSDAPTRMETSEEAARRIAGGWFGHGPKQHQRAIVDIAHALTAARIEGERVGLERAAQWHDEQALGAHERMRQYGPENDIDGMRHRMAGTNYSAHLASSAAIRSLAKELTQ